MKRLFQLLNILGYVILYNLIVHSCANIGTIDGGLKDTVPPFLVESEPVPYDTGFKDKKVILTFNEFFEFKDINQEFYSSPPIKKIPEFKIKKKHGIIKFEDELKDSVTYTFNFGNAIADYNEGNKLYNFRFVFSTNSKIDSFSIGGNLKNANDLSIPEKTFVNLYDTWNDSVVMKEIPSYMGKIDSSGNFSIDNIKAGRYKIFALTDLNGNLMADEFEPRAFIDSLIIPTESNAIQIDSLKAGTIIHDFNDPEKSDSLENDTVIVSNKHKTWPSDLQLYMFKEDNLIQKITDHSRPARRKMDVSFQLPVGDDLKLIPINATIAAENLIIEKNTLKDTLTLWLNDTIVQKQDSLLFQVTYLRKDSLGSIVPYIDTLIFEFREKKADDAWKRKQGSAKKVEKEYLKINFLVKEQKIDLNKSLVLESPTPLVTVDTSKIRLFEIKDTLTLDTKEQKIEKAYRLRGDLLYFKFSRPIAKKFSMEGINFKSDNWYSISPSDSNRVYTCQITDNSLIKQDSLKIKMRFDNHFFMDQIQELTDTVELPLTSQKVLTRKRPTADKINLTLYKPQETNIEIIPDDFSAKGNFYQIQKNKGSDSITILLVDKKVADLDTLTFSMKCFNYIDFNNDSVYFEETMRLIFVDNPQYLVSAQRPKKEELVFAYNKQTSQNPQLNPQNFTINNSWNSISRNVTGDTIKVKITDKFVSDMDTLGFIVNLQDVNRKGQLINFSDTIKFVDNKKIDIKKKTVAETSEKKQKAPEIVHIYLPAKYKLGDDSTSIRRRIIDSDWKSNTKYVIRYDSVAFVDFFNNYTKTGEFEFASQEKDFYSTLSLNLININAFDIITDTTTTIPDSLSNENEPKGRRNISRDEINKYLGDGHIIFQLLSEKGEVLREFFMSKEQEIIMDYLAPGKYWLKIIFDKNNNGKWDTGNYFKKIQPERVIMSGSPIEVKSKFDGNFEWNVGEFLIYSFTAD
jgi:hypothetical protein